MRIALLSSTLLGLSLATCLTACSGGTDTASGNGTSASPSGSGSGSGRDGTEASDNNRSDTEPTPHGSDGETDVPKPNDPADPSDPGNPKNPNNPNAPPPASGVDGVIEVPQATATATSASFVLSQSQKTKRIEIGTTNLSCPVSLSSTQAPYVYVQLKNTGPKRALTSVWTSTSVGGPSNTADALTIYPGTTPPATDAAREQCLGTVSWSCSGSPCTGWPGLSSANGDAVEVPANSSVLVFVQGEAAKTGSFTLNVRTDFLQ